MVEEKQEGGGHIPPGKIGLKTLFMMFFIPDLTKSCEMEMYRVEKSNV